MSDKKRENTLPSVEADKDTTAHDYVRRKWVEKDLEIVPEQCRTGRCGHKEHRIKHKKND